MWVAFLMFCVSESVDPANWIGQSLGVIGNLNLKQLTLPGTHDSGTYYLTDVPMPGDQSNFWEEVFILAEATDTTVGKVAEAWAKSQDQDFFGQLMGGIRYFDLRSGWNKTHNTWVTFHFVQGSPVQYLLSNISQFLDSHPQEIIVVEMSHFEGYPTPSDVTSLKTMVLDTLGNYLHPVDLTFSFTVQEMVSSGKRVLLTMEQGFDYNTIWPPTVIYNTYADTSDLSKMIEFNNKTVQLFMGSNWPQQVFKVSWTLTPGGTSISESVLPWKPHSLIQLADYGNKALPSFYNSISKNHWRMGNILIIDHYESSMILQIVLDMNGIN